MKRLVLIVLVIVSGLVNSLGARYVSNALDDDGWNDGFNGVSSLFVFYHCSC